MQGRVHSLPKHDDVICSRRSDDNWQALLRYRRAPTQKQRCYVCDSPAIDTLHIPPRDIRAIRRPSGRRPCQGRHAGSFGTNLRGGMAPCRGPGERDPDTQIPPPPPTKNTGREAPGQADAQGAATDRFIFDSLILACVALVFTARHAANVASRAPTRRLSESRRGHRTRQRVHLEANLGEASPDSGVAALAGIPDRVTSDLTWARRFALAADS